jgi:hypothetical protein
MSFYYSFFPPLGKTVKESFQNQGSTGLGVVALLGIILLIVVQVFIVRFLWNTVLVGLVSGVRPLKSLLKTLGLIILIAMLVPGSM